MMSPHLSDLRIDELLADELASDEAVAATAHLDDCERCRGRRRELSADRAVFRSALPALPRRRWVGTAALAAVAAAAGVAIVLRDPAREIRSKGGARLGLVVVHGEAMWRGGQGERTHPGDTLSYVVTTAEPAYVAVVSRDAAGRVTTYVPPERVAAGRDVQLSLATVLDDALGAERLYGVFCAEPIAEAALRDAPDRAPPGCVVDRIDIEKLR